MIVGLVHGGGNAIELTRSLIKLGEARSFEFASIRSSALIAEPRNRILRYAASRGDDLLFVDSDIGFAPVDIECLYEVDEPIVSALYYGQSEDGTTFPVGHVWDGESLRHVTEDELVRPYTLVAGVGMGCTLIRRKVVMELGRKEKPLFPFRERLREGQIVGEDVAFCLEAAKKGFGVAIRTDTPVDHVKTHVI